MPITFPNSLDQVQACSGSKLFDTLMAFLKQFSETTVNFEMNPQTKKLCKNTQHAELKAFNIIYEYTVKPV